jgi:hypothetical protein
MRLCYRHKMMNKDGWLGCYCSKECRSIDCKTDDKELYRQYEEKLKSEKIEDDARLNDELRKVFELKCGGVQCECESITESMSL